MPNITELVGKMEVESDSMSKKGKKKTVVQADSPLLLISHELSLPRGKGEVEFGEGPVMLHRAPAKLVLIGMHAKLALVSH